MAIGCGASCAKYFLFVSNFLFWLSGIGLIVIGALVASGKESDTVRKFVDGSGDLKIAAYLLIIIGVFIFVVGFCGCCGAIRESRCLLGFFIFFLVIVMVCEIAIGVFVAIYRKPTGDWIKKEWKKSLNANYTKIVGASDEKKNFTKNMDDIQQKGKCCGIESPDDWKNTNYYKTENNNRLPASCTTDGKEHTKGCYSAMKESISQYTTLIIIAGFGMALFELVTIAAAILLCCNTEYK